MNLLNFVNDTLNNGGASFNLLTGEYNPKTGYMVATQGNEIVIPLKQFHNASVSEYIAKKSYMLLSGISNTSLFLGSWVDGDKVYLDISEKVEDRHEAVKLGIERKQLAIWDNANGKEIRLK